MFSSLSNHEMTSAGRRIATIGVLVLLASASIGCRAKPWPAPELAIPLDSRAEANPRCDEAECCESHWFDWHAIQLARAEELYSEGVERREACNETCVDSFYEAIRASWPALEHQASMRCSCQSRAWQIYHSSVSQLVDSAQQFGRFELPFGLRVKRGAETILIPVNRHGFVWKPEDFNHFLHVGDYSDKELNNIHRTEGFGVPLIVTRQRQFDEPMLRRTMRFSATALALPKESSSDDEFEFSLDLFDPMRVRDVHIGATQAKLYRDLSAPFAYSVHTATDEYLLGFLQPGMTSEDQGLFMVEPYQPGKIPIVFVHGLMSEPTTWITMANELRAHPDLMERYQLWAFQYPTGKPFVVSAADLREQLQEARQLLDPESQDPALDNMMFVGHSMGGLVAKLQITSSGTEFWDSVSCLPFDQIVANDKARYTLARAFFFEPLPFITRVVYIGTPHRGSNWAQRSIGKLGSSLVEEPEQLREEHERLIEDNPGVFSDEMENRIPTSVGMMQPKSAMLQTLDGLPKGPNVEVHNVIGYGRRMLVAGPADGVVPVSSAIQRDVKTEMMVDRKHTELHRSNEVIAEIVCLMRRHLAGYDAKRWANLGRVALLPSE